MDEKKKRKMYPTSAQKQRLVQLLEADDELRSGKFSASFTKRVAEARWTAIACELNSVPGTLKTWSEWRKTWQDMKAKAKKRQAIIPPQPNNTGVVPPPLLDPLNYPEIHVMNTKSEPCLSDHTDSEESITSFEENIKTVKGKKPVAQQCLGESLPTAIAIKEILQEKNEIKRNFYQNYLKEMRRQTDALLLIAENLKK